MEIVKVIGEWFISTIDSFFGRLGLSVNIYTQVAAFLITGFLILLLFNELLKSREYRRYQKVQEMREALPSKMVMEEKAISQNGLATMLPYPVIFRLLDPDIKGEENGDTLGYIIKPSPAGEKFLFFEGEWSKLSVVQSLHHLIIGQIEIQMQYGVKISEEESTPPGHFEWNGTIWKIERTLSFAVRVEKGSVYSFPGGKGAIELTVATPYRKEEHENGTIVLEKQSISFRRKVNETWMGYHAFEVTKEEVNAEIGELLETLVLPN